MSINNAPLFNKSALRSHMLERIKTVNPGAGDKFKQVADQAYVDLDYRFRQVVDGYLKAQRVGRTITTP